MERTTETEITVRIVEMLDRIQQLIFINCFPEVHGEALLDHLKDSIHSILAEYCFDHVVPTVYLRANSHCDYDYLIRFSSESDAFFWSLLRVTTDESVALELEG